MRSTLFWLFWNLCSPKLHFWDPKSRPSFLFSFASFSQLTNSDGLKLSSPSAVSSSQGVFWKGVSSLLRALGTLQTVSWGNHSAHLTVHLSLRDHCVLSSDLFLSDIWSPLCPFIFGCFKQVGKSGPSSSPFWLAVEIHESFSMLLFPTYFWF